MMDEKPGNGAPKPRKMKFKPRAPPQREQKLVLPKPEKFEDDAAVELKTQELMKRFKESTNKPRFKTETQPSKTRVSSFSFGPGGNVASSSIGAKEYKEPWDYYKYYPVTLPARVPLSGNPELLDEEEFKEDSETNIYNESSLKPAEELCLLEENLERKLVFIQMPATMPIPNQSVKKEGSSKPSRNATKPCSLNELPTGKMGKMLVYKSGAVKLKLGDHLYNVTGGLDCSFAQDLVSMNTEEKYCCTVGELNKRAIVTPDIESVLDNMGIS